MKTPALLACAALVLLQIAPAPYRLEAPPLDAALTFDADQQIPATVKKVLRRACLNCHSLETRVPWYGRVAPASWILARDVAAARQAMNLSEWLAKSTPYRLAMAAAACEDVRSGRMPKSHYLLLHPEARLTPHDVQAVCSWPQAVLAGMKPPRPAPAQ